MSRPTHGRACRCAIAGISTIGQPAFPSTPVASLASPPRRALTAGVLASSSAGPARGAEQGHDRNAPAKLRGSWPRPGSMARNCTAQIPAPSPLPGKWPPHRRRPSFQSTTQAAPHPGRSAMRRTRQLALSCIIRSMVSLMPIAFLAGVKIFDPIGGGPCAARSRPWASRHHRRRR
jgi:hypothetical protein